MIPTKLSILALYMRIFSTRHLRIAIWVVVAICICWGVGGLLPTILQCIPVEYNWNRSLVGRCIDIPMLFSAITISNFLTDVLILILPMFMIYQLQLNTKQKLMVASIFLAGSTACICALIRIISGTKFGNDITCKSRTSSERAV